MYIMIPAKFHLKSHKMTPTLKLKACHFSRKKRLRVAPMVSAQSSAPSNANTMKIRGVSTWHTWIQNIRIWSDCRFTIHRLYILSKICYNVFPYNEHNTHLYTSTYIYTYINHLMSIIWHLVNFSNQQKTKIFVNWNIQVGVKNKHPWNQTAAKCIRPVLNPMH